MQVTLSTGEQVTLKDRFTHKMHKARFSALNKGVVWKQNLETGEYEKELPAENMEFQYEPVIRLALEKIEKDGKPVPFTDDWLDNLLQEDYGKLEQAVIKLQLGEAAEGGEKKAPKAA